VYSTESEHSVLELGEKTAVGDVSAPTAACNLSCQTRHSGSRPLENNAVYEPRGETRCHFRGLPELHRQLDIARNGHRQVSCRRRTDAGKIVGAPVCVISNDQSALAQAWFEDRKDFQVKRFDSIEKKEIDPIRQIVREGLIASPSRISTRSDKPAAVKFSRARLTFDGSNSVPMSRPPCVVLERGGEMHCRQGRVKRQHGHWPKQHVRAAQLAATPTPTGSHHA
jgi:hypothetical protein